MQQSEEIVTQSRIRFVRQHWHILCVGLCLLIAFILGGFSVTESVLNIQYPVWLMVPWIMINVLLFLASILLALPYLFRVIRVGWNPEPDGWAFMVLILGMIYIVFGGVLGLSAGAGAFSWIAVCYLFIMFVVDIVGMAMGIPQPKEKKQD